MRSISIRSRLVLVAVGATLVACIALSIVGYRLSADQVETSLRSRASAIASRVELLVTEGSAYQTQESLDRLYEEGSFRAAVVFSPTREIVAAAPAPVVEDAVVATWPGAEDAIERFDLDGVQVSSVARPLVTGGRAWFVFDRAPYAAARERFQIIWAVAGGGALVVALLAAWLVGTPVTRRLRAIGSAVDRLTDGDFTARCDEGGPGEIAAIARSFNTMAARIGSVVNELGDERTALEQQVTGRTRELEQANRLLMDIANRDALTGLANRRRLEMELERNISFSKRTGQPLAVIMMDLDKFKICNDTAGHLVGDNILRAVASTLRSRVRVTDLVVRWGGDEFCILVPATQPQGAIAAAESLVDAVKEATSAIALPAPLEPPTASAGVACYPEDGEDPHTLILNADAALYQVKATGRGRVLRYSEGFTKD
ncbi:MAG: diguanylate cyclase [Holophagae bacterium]|jgi:diguanylate cyclase (GGDEF)-like protein